MKAKSLLPYLLLIVCIFIFTIACDSHNKTKLASTIKDAPLASYQVELLTIAFESASAMPVNPHIKSRSLAQETVVNACLELKQPKRALGYIEQIDNWRKEACYAELALYLAQRGASKEDVQYYLNLAAQISDETEDWRKDQIKNVIAKTNTYMQQTEETADSFDKEMEALEKLVSTDSFDTVQNALGTYTKLYHRFYSDAKRRILIEEKIKASSTKIPISIRLDFLMEMADVSLTHADRVKALELVNEAKTIMNSADWPSGSAIPLMAKLAELRFRCGDKQQARTEVHNALSLFDTEREKIVNIDRAQMLRPIAEAYWAMGDSTLAIALYKRAIEAGIENKNSRPRAEDLVATCCSMALHGVEPDAELLDRIRQICNGLADPW